MNVFELFGKIAIDSSGAKKGIDGAVKHAKGAESKLAATFKKIGTAAAAAFSVRAIVDFGKQCTQAYANIAAEESAFAQIMGDYSETAQAKLDAVADQTGVASTRMTGAMTSLTAKFKGLGYGVEDATTLAADGLLIASDAAAFWDMSLDESMSHLNSFINGSYEGGEAIGLFANDTQMAAFAIEQGIVKDAKAWAKLDEAQRQATRLLYAKQMMENSGATGQAAKEADAYANVMANLKESWRQFQGVVGKPILEKLVLPAMKKLNAFLPTLTESVQNGIVWLETGFEKIKGYFTEVFTEDGIKWDAVPDAMSKMFKDLRTSASKHLKKFGQTLRNGWSNTVWPTIQKTFKAAFGVELPDWATVKQDISDGWNNTVWPAVQGYFSKRFDITLPSWTELKTKITNSWNNTIKPAIKDLFSVEFKVNEPVAETLINHLAGWWNKHIAPGLNEKFVATFGVKPEDSTGYEVGGTLRGWVDKVLEGVLGVGNDALTLLVGVAPKDAEGSETGEAIKTWWSGVETYIGNIFKGFFHIEPGSNEETTANTVLTFWKGVTALATFTISPTLSFPLLSDAIKSIKEWWDGVVKDLKLSLPFGLGNLFGGGDEEEGEKGSAGVNENGQGGAGGDKFPADAGSGTGTGGWNPELRGMWRYPNMEFGKQGGANSLPGILASLPAQIEAAAKNGSAAGCAEGVGSIQITGSVTTGNVMLDTGVVAGQIAPRINLMLGGLSMVRGR